MPSPSLSSHRFVIGIGVIALVVLVGPLLRGRSLKLSGQEAGGSCPLGMPQCNEFDCRTDGANCRAPRNCCDMFGNITQKLSCCNPSFACSDNYVCNLSSSGGGNIAGDSGGRLACVSDDDCPDTEPCTLDRCVGGTCVHDPNPTDTDNDGAPDCVDQCPSDPAKIEPQECGCHEEETPNCGASGSPSPPPPSPSPTPSPSPPAVSSRALPPPLAVSSRPLPPPPLLARSISSAISSSLAPSLDKLGINSVGSSSVFSRPPICGDGIVQSPNEECDDGRANSYLPNACRPYCQKAWCGDGITDTATEDCDAGAVCIGGLLDGPQCAGFGCVRGDPNCISPEACEKGGGTCDFVGDSMCTLYCSSRRTLSSASSSLPPNLMDFFLKACMRCGDGFFNLCDEQECESFGPCTFTKSVLGAMWGTCRMDIKKG